MSRELKFRAWDGMNMYDHVLPFQWDFVLNAMAHKCVASTGPGLLGSVGDTALFEIEGYRFKEIMEFTGLKDDDDIDIYQDDIVAIEYDRSWEERERERETDTDQVQARRKAVGVVKWNEHSTGWILETKSPMSVNDRGTVMTSIIHGPDGSRKVLGNIHQHKHLLDGKV